jgi:hypothetical protein
MDSKDGYDVILRKIAGRFLNIAQKNPAHAHITSFTIFAQNKLENS